MTTNPNEVSKYHPTQEQLDAIYARTAEQALARREAEQRAREWPGLVERTLAALAGRAERQDELLASIEARLAAVEAALGIPRG